MANPATCSTSSRYHVPVTAGPAEKPGRPGDRGQWACMVRARLARGSDRLLRPVARSRRAAIGHVRGGWREHCGSAFAGQPVVSPGARQPCSMTMMLSWAAPRSTLSHGHGIESSHLTPDRFRLGARGSGRAPPRPSGGRSARSDNAPTGDCGAWPFRPPPVTSRSLSTRPHRIGCDLKKAAMCSKSPSLIASEIARCRVRNVCAYKGASFCDHGSDLRDDHSPGGVAIFSASALGCDS